MKHIKQGYVLVSWWKCDQRLAGTYLCVSPKAVIGYWIIQHWRRLFLEPNHMNNENQLYTYTYIDSGYLVLHFTGILINTIWPLFPLLTCLLILSHKSLLQPNWQSFFCPEFISTFAPPPHSFHLHSTGEQSQGWACEPRLSNHESPCLQGRICVGSWHTRPIQSLPGIFHPQREFLIFWWALKLGD